MPRSALAARIAGAMVALAAVAGCNGNVIRLGNGRTDGGDAACPHAQVNANEVLWIGDSWVLVPGNEHTAVAADARATGAIGASDDYVIAAVPASNMAAVAGQYTAREAGATRVKVLIMDGGTWDTIMSNASAASVSSVASTFSQLLATVASDGTVDHIIYFLVPELSTIPGVAALRPLLSDACTQSTVPCHFLDLQPLWAGHPEYTVSGSFVPTDAGGGVIAAAIWALMQQNCIAQ
jgi:hypothetical protein